MLVQLFSQQKNIVGMAEVLSKRIDDRKIAKLAQIDPATGAPGADQARIMAETTVRASSRQIARLTTEFSDTIAECVLGTFIAFFAMYLLCKNESKKVNVDRLLSEAQEVVKEVRDVKNPNKNLNFNLVYVSGVAKNEFALEDPILGVKTQNSAKLVRKVEMYQWKPFFDGKDRFGSDLVAFRKVWSEKVIASAKNPIGYLNPLDLPIPSEVYHSRNVTLGNYVLGNQ